MEIEGQESVVETSEGTESQSETTESSQSTEAPAQAAASKPDEPQIDWDKAFKHERFQQLVNQKNEALEKSRSLELKLAQLEGRMSAPQSQAQQAERDELIEDLKKVDPRLAARIEAFAKSSQTIEQLQKKLDELESGNKQRDEQSVIKELQSKVASFNEANKVSPAIKKALDAELTMLYYGGKLNPQNVEQAYKTAYEPYKAYAEELKRETLKGYVPSKQADSKVPSSQPKGAPASKPKPVEKQKFKDREELTNAVAKEFIQQQRAKREASPV